MAATNTVPSSSNLDTFNQLSVGPNTFSAGKFKASRRGLRDIFDMTMTPGLPSAKQDGAAAAADTTTTTTTTSTGDAAGAAATEQSAGQEEAKATVVDGGADSAARQQRREDTINKRLVLLGEYIGACSREARMTVVSLPVPAAHQRPEVRACVCACACVCAHVHVHACVCRELRAAVVVLRNGGLLTRLLGIPVRTLSPTTHTRCTWQGWI